uniref:Uncharacterized protein n=1 Tax=mine drainage metagenome TaxID=410659 RepID=E6QN13_9ZZZZ
MQITVEISEDFAARANQLGLTPEAYASELLLAANRDELDAAWEAEALRRAAEIDSGNSQPVPWEQIQSRLHARIAG